jgi:hypothetical protein
MAKKRIIRSRRGKGSKKVDRYSHPRYTIKQIATALKENLGFISVAARKLGCERQTIYNAIERHPELAAIRSDAKELDLDETELILKQLIRDKHFPAVRFKLLTRGRERGYVERVEHTGAEGGPIEIADRQQTLAELDKRMVRLAIAKGEKAGTESTDNGPVGRA